jgi:hypothetical protein
MSAEALQKVIVESHRGAQNQLTNFHSAMDRGNTKAAGTALQTAAQAICYGLKNAVEDNVFWTEAGALIRNAHEHPPAINEVLSDLERLVEQEGHVLTNGGFNASEVAELLGEFVLTLRVFGEVPNEKTLELTRIRVLQTQKQICAIAGKKVEIVSVNIWGRAYRAVKNGLRSVNGVGTIAFDVVAAGAGTAATGGAAAPYAVGLAVVSVAGGMATIMSVGEDIYGGLTIRR